MKKIRILLVLIFFTCSLYSQSTDRFSIGLSPEVTFPLGSSPELFSMGYGGDLSLTFTPKHFPFAGIRLGGIYQYTPTIAESSISSITAYGGPVLNYFINERFSIHTPLTAGYYHWFPINEDEWQALGDNGGSYYLSGGGEILFRLAGILSLGAGIYYDYQHKLYNGLRSGLSIKLDFPALKKKGLDLEINEIQLDPVYPVLFAHYDKNPIGTVTILNTGAKEVNNGKLSIYINRLMDNPMNLESQISLKPGEKAQFYLYALFNEEVMNITEGTTVSVKLSLERSVGNDSFSRDFTGSLMINNRNALSWSDDERIASFITAKDPDILNYSKNIITSAGLSMNPVVDSALQKAMVLFEAVKADGIRYVVDPVTPYNEYNIEKDFVDFIQFPRQTLQFSAGDCDDLTALYLALLEAVGVETGFITVPGHIYAAFALDSSPEKVMKTFSNYKELILQDNKYWLPVEITMFQDSFEQAKIIGIQQWWENVNKEKAFLYPTREAWIKYRAVGFREGRTLTIPDLNTVNLAFRNTLESHIIKEISPLLTELSDKANGAANPYPYLNKKGVLLSRYGMYAQAQEIWDDLLIEKPEYLPALVNRANLSYLQKQYEESLGYYSKVLEIRDNSQLAVLGVARCSYMLENYYQSKKSMEQLEELNPKLAEKYSFLGGSSDEYNRAGLSEIIIWEE